MLSKNILLVVLLGFLSNAIFGQASLPSLYSFDNSFAGIDDNPLGYTYNLNQVTGNLSYSDGSDASPACRLDGTGEYVQVYLGASCGLISYKLKVKTVSTLPFEGTFVLQESADGNNWSILRSIGDGAVNKNSYTQFSDLASATSRYLRFNFISKKSGWNLALDEIEIYSPAPSPAQEINIKQGAENVFSGGTLIGGSAVGVKTSLILTAENLGTVNALQISSFSITGAAASDFSVATVAPFSISANSSSSIFIDFTPSQPGSRKAQLSISNNDSDENPYLINLYGIGDDFASEPTAASNLLFSNVKTFGFRVNFSASVPAVDNPGGYLVLLKKDSAIPSSDYPSDGREYFLGEAIGASKVVYVGKGTSFNFKNSIADQQYYLAVFSYNGAKQYINYNTNAVLASSVSTPTTMMGAGAYTGIATGSSSFISDLTSRIRPHNSIYYSNYASTMIKQFAARDTYAIVGNTAYKRVIDCMYSGEVKLYNEPFDFSALNFSREHTYSHSWMPSAPADNPEQPEYNDQHNLYPTRMTDANLLRCNYPLGDVETVLTAFLDGKLGYDKNGNKVYEPKANHKGRAARAMMYMAVCYNTGSQNWAFKNPIGNCSATSINYGQDQEVLKKWHYQYPPDGWEIARNDYLDSLQGNRNPFIDKIFYACYIDFSNMTYIAEPPFDCRDTTPVSVDPYKVMNLSIEISPNPNAGNFRIHFSNSTKEAWTIKVIDLLGNLVESRKTFTEGFNQLDFSMENFSKGIYLLVIEGEHAVFSKKLILY